MRHPNIFSTDVEAMYPALDIDVIARVASEEFLKSDLDIPVNEEELALYCAIVLDEEELDTLGLTDVCHTRAKSGGRKPGITTQEVSGRTDKNKDKSLFVKPARKPSPNEVKKMFSLALKVLIKAAMKNHIYTWDGSIKKQSKGGAIGSDLTGELGVFFMLVWTSIFIERVKYATLDIPNWEMHMLFYYIDDGNLIVDPLPLGSRLVGNKIMVVDRCILEDFRIPPDERTAKILTQLGNNICDFIKLTSDFPSAHESGYMPLLDIQTNILDGKVNYVFYKKPMTNPLLLRANSAMPLKMKRTALIQEALRRLLRTKRELPWSLKAEILSEFSHKMFLSGYWEKFRFEVLEAAVRAYELKCEKADLGIEPLHRPRSYKREERRKKKLMTPYIWCQPADAPLFVPATPGSVLQKRVQRVTDKHMERIGMSLKVIETAGKKIGGALTNLDLTGCWWPDCYLCECDTKGASHTRAGATYTGTCRECGGQNVTAVYDGETGRSGYYRTTKGHKEDIVKNKTDKSALAKHTGLYHPDKTGDPSIYSVKVNNITKSSLLRQVREGQSINDNTADIVCNGKGEWHVGAVPKAQTRHASRDVRPGS